MKPLSVSNEFINDFNATECTYSGGNGKYSQSKRLNTQRMSSGGIPWKGGRTIFDPRAIKNQPDI